MSCLAIAIGHVIVMEFIAFTVARSHDHIYPYKNISRMILIAFHAIPDCTCTFNISLRL